MKKNDWGRLNLLGRKATGSEVLQFLKDALSLRIGYIYEYKRAYKYLGFLDEEDFNVWKTSIGPGQYETVELNLDNNKNLEFINNNIDNPSIIEMWDLPKSGVGYIWEGTLDAEDLVAEGEEPNYKYYGKFFGFIDEDKYLEWLQEGKPLDSELIQQSWVSFRPRIVALENSEAERNAAFLRKTTELEGKVDTKIGLLETTVGGKITELEGKVNQKIKDIQAAFDAYPKKIGYVYNDLVNKISYGFFNEDEYNIWNSLSSGQSYNFGTEEEPKLVAKENIVIATWNIPKSIGCVYEDITNEQQLGFFNEADRDKYLANRTTNANLVLATWKIPKNTIGWVIEDHANGRFLGFADLDRANRYLADPENNLDLIITLWNNSKEQGIPIYTKRFADSLPDSSGDYIVIPNDSDVEDSNVENYTYDTSINGPLANILFSAIRKLQSEIAKIKNTFNYGMYSYTGTNTAMSKVLGDYSSLESWREEEEPLWAIDEQGLSKIGELYIGPNTNLSNLSNVNSELSGVLYIQLEISSWNIESLLSGVEDPKILIYTTSNNFNIKFNIKDLNNQTKILDLNLLNLENIGNNNLYSILVIFTNNTKNNTDKNFIWISIKNVNSDTKILEGYLNLDNYNVTEYPNYSSNLYLPTQIDFTNIKLSKCNIYSKYQDFSEEVISSTPSEEDYRYKVAHITIRSVDTYNTLDRIKNLLPENELIFIEDTKQLYIKNNFSLVAISASGGNSEGNNQPHNNDGMEREEIIQLLENMGINILETENPDGNTVNLDLSGITFIHQETGIKFNLEIDGEGNLRTTKISDDSLLKRIKAAFRGAESIGTDNSYRGFIGRLGSLEYANTLSSSSVAKDMKLYSDRLKIGAFYAPSRLNKTFGCSHCFVELENTSDKDILLEGCYLHYLKGSGSNNQIFHLALTGTIPAGGTYLIRGAKKSEFDDVNTFIKVITFDLEWYIDNELIDFSHSGTTLYVNQAYIAMEGGAFALTYGKEDLAYNDYLWDDNTGANKRDAKYLYPPYYIDSICFNKAFEDGGGKIYWALGSPAAGVANIMSYIKGENNFPDCIYRNTFELDPAKLAFQALNSYDASRYRHQTPNDYLYLYLGKEFIEFPHSEEKCPISKFTPKASFEHKNVCTDKTQLDVEKPNMVTCSFGKNPYTTRCFNWVSGGLFDEYVFIKDLSNNTWHKFESYKEGDGTNNFSNNENALTRKEFSENIINCIYKRMTGRFPAANTLYTAHKCIINIVSAAVQSPTTYTYIVGRADKNGNPDLEHCSEEYTFTLYPTSYIPRIYLTTDLLGFHWVEYLSWAAAANVINDLIINDSSPTRKYTLEEVNAYNRNLSGALNSNNALTSEQANNYNNAITGASKLAGDILSLEEANTYNATLTGAKTTNDLLKIIPVLINSGDMTLSGARINEWLDYYNAGKPLFKHLEQMNVVGNNDLCGNNFNILGTGDDEGKANSYYFHVFYCYEVETELGMIPIINSKYVPSLYRIMFNTQMLLFVNSEITLKNCSGWFNVSSSENYTVNVYTGWEIRAAESATYLANTLGFTPIYTMLYNMTDNLSVPFIAICHEMPFTVITKDNLAIYDSKNRLVVELIAGDSRSISRKGEGEDVSYSLVGSHLNLLSNADSKSRYWFSRLLEFRKCRLCLGGHKHTYAITYPVMENYIYTEGGVLKRSSIDGPMTMTSTLEEDSVVWTDIKSNITVDLSKFPLTKTKNTSGPDGGGSFNFSRSKVYFYPSEFVTSFPGTNNSGIVYFMCQASGFKLMSNKELPSNNLSFSLYLPKSNEEDGKAANTLRYPMYAIIDTLNNHYTIELIRLKNIHSGVKLLSQITYGTGNISKEYLYDNSVNTDPNNAEDMKGWKYGGWTTTPTNIINI